jgi:hypothetical protein
VSVEPPPEKPRIPQPISIGGGWSFVYAIAAIGFFGVAGWLAFGRKVPLTDPSVIVAVLGGLWFVARVFMTMRKKP